MKKTTVRLIAIALVLLMALALIPLAAWADGPYTITFYPNYPGGGGEQKVVYTDNEGKHVILAPENYGISTPDGYVFIGWNGSQAGNATWHAVGEEVTLDHDWPQYAQWGETVTVSFAANGGSGEMGALTVAAGREVFLPECGFNYERHTFTGWLGSNGQAYADGARITPAASLVMTAQWEEDEDPDIAGGTSGSGSTKTASARAVIAREGNAQMGGVMAAQAAAHGVALANAPYVAFYVWCEWDKNNSDRLTADEITAEAAKGNLDFVVEYPFPDELDAEGSDVYAYLYNHGSNADSGDTVTAVSGTADEDGIAFSGTLLANAAEVNPTTLVLLYVPKDSVDNTGGSSGGQTTVRDFTMNFDANGGGGSMDSVTKLETEAFYAPACSFTAPANKRFAHWCTSRDGSGTTYSPNEMVAKNVEFSSMTLFAIWEDIPASTTPAALNGTVTITGLPNPGEVLTATVTGSNNSGSLSYQWLKDGEAINGENRQTYTVPNNALNTAISCRVTSSVETGSRISNPITIVAASKGTPGTSEPVRDVSFPENKIAALKQNYGNLSGIKVEVYEVSACWNGNPNSPMTSQEIAENGVNGKISFVLPYPAGTADGGYDFHVYHFADNATNPEEISYTLGTDGLHVSSGAFSDFAVLAVPLAPTEGNVLIGGSPVVGGTLSAVCGGGITDPKFQWMSDNNNIVGATGGTYKVTSADIGHKITVKVTAMGSTTLAEPIVSANYVTPTAKVDPKVTQGVYNDGETGKGVISNVDSNMEYIFSGDYQKSPDSAKWKAVTGTQITGLTKGGLYYVQLKDNPGSRVSINVPSYYSVRVYEKVKNTRYMDGDGNSTPRHGTLSPKATIVEAGTTLTIEAVPNRNYVVYDVQVNGKSVEWTRSGRTWYVKAKNINERTYVDVKFLYTGSSPRTGDDSHPGAWSALAVLSLLGAGAALTVLKKKSRG